MAKIPFYIAKKGRHLILLSISKARLSPYWVELTKHYVLTFTVLLASVLPLDVHWFTPVANMRRRLGLKNITTLMRLEDIHTEVELSDEKKI